MDTLLLVLRVGLSLAAVLGLMWWLARRAQAGAGARRRRGETVAVVGRQQLGKRSGVAVVEVTGRRLVLGYGDTGVTLLHDAGELPEPDPTEGPDLSGPDASSSELPTEIEIIRAADAAPGTPARDAGRPTMTTTSARMADVRLQHSPLEGSILAPATWRKAVAALQDRTARRS